jgi:hypothetical protein
MQCSRSLSNSCSYSCYHFHSNRVESIVTFIKNKELFAITIDYDIGIENILTITITEDKLKTIPVLWFCYITSLILTEDTSKLYEEDGNHVIYKKQVWKNLYITMFYSPQVVDISTVSFVPSSDNYIDEKMDFINSIVLISKKLFEKLIEEKLQNTEKALFKCEMTVDRIRALNKIVPENFPKDLYNILHTQLV